MMLIHFIIIIIFIAGFHDMNYVHTSHKGGNETSKKKKKTLKLKK